MRSERTFVEQARREQIISAAVDQLAEAGYAGTTLAAIAARIEVSKAALLYHFKGGKDELLSAVVSSVIDDAAEQMTARIEAEPTAIGKLHAYIRSNVGYLVEHRRPILALAAVVNGAPPSPDGATVYEPLGEQAVQALVALLEAGQRSRQFGRFSAPVVARCLRGAIDGLEPLLRAGADSATLDSYAEELVAIFDKVVAP